MVSEPMDSASVETSSIHTADSNTSLIVIDQTGFKAVGYGELISHLEGERSLADAVAEAKRSTRQFVRRQLTWLRNQLPVDAIRLSANEPRERLVAEIARRWESGARRSSGSQPESPVASCG